MDNEARIFRALGEPTRLRLAAILAAEGETCVCALAGALGVSDFNVSRHLGVLRAAGIVQCRREGTWMHYRLAEAGSELERRLRECLRECLAESPSGLTDRQAAEAARFDRGTPCRQAKASAKR